MKKIIPFLVLTLSFSLSALLSNAQNNLEKSGGFKKYKLLSKYTNIYGQKAKTEEGPEMVSITYCPETIGDIPVDKIELYYLRDSLYRIKVFVAANNYEKLLNACKGSYGAPAMNLSNNETTQSQDSTLSHTGSTFADRYRWKSGKIVMDYNYIYPKSSGNPYAPKQLYLLYEAANYESTLKRVKSASYSSSDF